jgi:hypothetical protein
MTTFEKPSLVIKQANRDSSDIASTANSIGKFLEEISKINLEEIGFEGRQQLPIINQRLMKVQPASVVRIILVCLTRGFKWHKYMQGNTFAVALGQSIEHTKLYVPDTSRARKGPGPEKIRPQEVLMAMPLVTCECLSYLMNNKRNLIFGEDYVAIPKMFQWPGSLVVFWTNGVKQVEDIGNNVVAYTIFIENYVRIRGQSGEETIKQKILRLINRSWLGKMLDAFDQDSVTALMEKSTVGFMPKAGGFSAEHKKVISKVCGFNPWRQIPRPAASASFDNDYLGKVERMLSE